ncbi:UDP-N-acetylmuramoyl-tripeptide--D-alanyl-D-alanine ligase [Megasphaera vaginalis (ex Srinivasan et al. 2021)]|uniref:UDP-N-acetylmuramoyl-tripeptide--D-alanyl-D-alanine ligase n=1 Tax=Megasphaera vaginalis (ex Srinivasan et al. 2021) TaxID=1111454 RepID=U7UCJ1_9FIRM|nr:UDP-N-acetylmuramoyl-tripeptide--D-alanyl-D-alanine ligase [Megasphaera vaginalis (ex Srinivasan et al. 2021)]ERT57090.1 UDP-N-acetylmuramoyl-tripeptide--D-alanyl-D-alanine ligase [Megasphaera vaginalis (ex Srinivasan et al. 2021)]
MAAFTIAEVIEATGARLLRRGNRENAFSSIDTDTRTLSPGSLFVALQGDTFDGHRFIAAALEGGAAGVLVARETEKYGDGDCTVFLVTDTLKAYQDLARFHRRRFAIPVIAVTGSVGKTSTRSIIATVLAQKYNVLQTEKNFNNEIGLPKTLLNLTEDHGVCVVEMGMRGLGQIAELAAIAEPTIGVVTNVGKSHIELLGSQENIAKAKAELVAALPSDGVAVLNQDDRYVAAMADICRAKSVTYGVLSNAVIRGCRIEANEKGLRFSCRCFDLMFDITMPVIGKYTVYNALAAVAVGRVLGLSEHQMRKGLSEYGGVPMRLELVRLDPYTFINDAYNANPASMSEAVSTLASLTTGRKIAVLGGMLELGDWTEREHRTVGRQIAAASIDALIVLGDEAAFIADEAKKEGMVNVWITANHDEAAAMLKSVLLPGDTVLLKGSRGFAMEKILTYFERK